MVQRVLILLLLVQLPAPGDDGASDAERGEHLRVFVVTMERGDLIWERWGHNMLCILDERAETETAYNWGLFDFHQKRFFRNFIRGEMWYWMEGWPLDATVYAYQLDNRSVWVQELELSPAQRAKLADFLAWNEQPENRYYSYDYYLDNCSTRVRDAVDLAVDGQLQAQTEPLSTGRSFRWHNRRLTADSFGWHVTLSALAGQKVDREINVWEEMFLPVPMMEHLRAVRVTNEAGELVPLVKREWTLFQGTRVPEPSAPPRRTGLYLLLGLGLGGLLVLLGHLAKRFGVARWLWSALIVLWALYTGGLGALLVYGWLFTYHWAGYWNENLMQLNPLGLGLVVLGPMAAFGYGRGLRWAPVVAVVIAAVAVLGVMVKILPWFGQVNAEVLALFVPLHVAVAAAAWLVSRRDAPDPGTAPKGDRSRGRGARATTR